MDGERQVSHLIYFQVPVCLLKNGKHRGHNCLEPKGMCQEKKLCDPPTQPPETSQPKWKCEWGISERRAIPPKSLRSFLLRFEFCQWTDEEDHFKNSAPELFPASSLKHTLSSESWGPQWPEVEGSAFRRCSISEGRSRNSQVLCHREWQWELWGKLCLSQQCFQLCVYA